MPPTRGLHGASWKDWGCGMGLAQGGRGAGRRLCAQVVPPLRGRGSFHLRSRQSAPVLFLPGRGPCLCLLCTPFAWATLRPPPSIAFTSPPPPQHMRGSRASGGQALNKCEVPPPPCCLALPPPSWLTGPLASSWLYPRTLPGPRLVRAQPVGLHGDLY